MAGQQSRPDIQQPIPITLLGEVAGWTFHFLQPSCSPAIQSFVNTSAIDLELNGRDEMMHFDWTQPFSKGGGLCKVYHGTKRRGGLTLWPSTPGTSLQGLESIYRVFPSMRTLSRRKCCTLSLGSHSFHELLPASRHIRSTDWTRVRNTQHPSSVGGKDSRPAIGPSIING